MKHFLLKCSVWTSTILTAVIYCDSKKRNGTAVYGDCIPQFEKPGKSKQQFGRNGLASNMGKPENQGRTTLVRPFLLRPCFSAVFMFDVKKVKPRLRRSKWTS